MELPANYFGTRNLSKGDKFLFIPYSFFALRWPRMKRQAVFCEVISVKDAGKWKLYEIKGLYYAKTVSFRKKSAYFEEIRMLNDPKTENISALLRKKSQEFVFLINTAESEKLIYLMNFTNDYGEFSDFTANYFILDYKSRHSIFVIKDVYQRYIILIKMLDKLIASAKKRLNSEKKSS